MVTLKPSVPPEGNKSKILTDRNNGQASKPKKYRGKNPQKHPSSDPKAETNFQYLCTDLEGYIFDFGPRASNKFAQTMKELEQYPAVTYSDSCQTYIITETHVNIPNPEMPTISDLGI